MTADQVNIISISPEVDGNHETQYLAMHDGKCIGRVGVRSQGLTCASVRQLYVEPAYRKKGIGRQLLKSCILRAALDQCESINLTVARNNRGVLPFYKREGFVIAYECSDGEYVLCRPTQVIFSTE